MKSLIDIEIVNSFYELMKNVSNDIDVLSQNSLKILDEVKNNSNSDKYIKSNTNNGLCLTSSLNKKTKVIISERIFDNLRKKNKIFGTEIGDYNSKKNFEVKNYCNSKKRNEDDLYYTSNENGAGDIELNKLLHSQRDRPKRIPGELLINKFKKDDTIKCPVLPLITNKK